MQKKLIASSYKLDSLTPFYNNFIKNIEKAKMN